MFSSLPEDESLDDVKPQRIKLDRSIYEEPIEVEELKDSVVVFDDIDVISDKKIRDAVYNILNKVLEIGRPFQDNSLSNQPSPNERQRHETHLKRSPPSHLFPPTAPPVELSIYLSIT